MKEHFVYELINLYGTVEYVGETTKPKERFNSHIRCKPGRGRGKFYGRTDLIMHIVFTFDNIKDARLLEGKLKTEYGMEWTELNRTIKGREIGAEKSKKPILQYTKTGDFIREWDSLTNVNKELKINIGNITSCAKGKYKSAGGYVWKYKK